MKDGVIITIIGILGAMPEEIGKAIEDLNEVVKSEYGDLTIFSGQWKLQGNP